MAKYYFPAKADKVNHILRHGLGLPKGDDPAIFALGSRSAADTFGRGMFGDNLVMLEINGEFSTYGTGEVAPVGFVAIAEDIPASSISRADGLKYIEEVGRQYFGGRYDDRAINAAAERTYKDIFGRTFQIHRELDSEDKAFQILGPIADDFEGILPVLEVDGSRSFGGGVSWKAAEEIADKVIGHDIENLRGLPCIYLYPDHEEGQVAVRVRAGLGVGRFEVWEVTQDHIDRGRWGSWLEQPGWYWQDISVAEIHGPFETSDVAIQDSIENLDTPGIQHPQDRPSAKMGL
jgi:hypothetical protein